MSDFASGACHFVSLCGLKPEVQAAWVQAVFSVIGIVVAILVPWLLRLAEQKERRRRDADVSRDLALLLLPSVRRWREQLSSSPDPGERLLGAEFNGSYRVPVEISSDIERLHLLGPAARHLQMAVFLAREFEADQPAVKADLRGDDLNSGTSNFEEKLERLIARLESAERAMSALFREGRPDWQHQQG